VKEKSKKVKAALRQRRKGGRNNNSLSNPNQQNKSFSTIIRLTAAFLPRGRYDLFETNYLNNSLTACP